MDNFDIVYFIVISLVTVILIVMSFVWSAKYNSNTRKEKNEKYARTRATSNEIEEKENFIMSALINGEIKCHKLHNSALPYNVDKWIDNMEKFMEKPVFNQLMKLKGHDIE